MTPSSPRARLVLRHSMLLALVGAVGLAGACATGGKTPPSAVSPGDDASASIPPPFGDDSGVISIVPQGDGGPQLACNPCMDFPATPIIDMGVTQDAATLGRMFGPAATGSGGPCLVEPQDGTLYPRNWVRPRFLFVPAAGAQSLYEIRIHSDFEVNDIVAYTANTQWLMPADAWQSLTSHVLNAPITVTVRSAAAPTAGSSSTFRVAPATADGAMIYWTTASFDNNANNTTLQGFHVGDEGVTTALTANQVAQQVRGQASDGGYLMPTFNPVYCIGCHTSTPDGDYVAFTAQWPWPNALASIQADSGAPVGAAPPWLTSAAASNLSPNVNNYYAPPRLNQIMMGIQTFSKAHYAPGDRVLISQLGAAWNSTSLTDPGKPTGVVSQLAWFDLEWNPPSLPDGGFPVAPCAPTTAGCDPGGTPNGGWGFIARNGDPNSAGAPSWSHDGKTIAYLSTDVGTKDGRVNEGRGDVMTVPYNNKAGGAAKPLQGASDPAFNEYYPAFSPDDQLIAFNRVATGAKMYNEPTAEVYVVKAGGEPTPTRLKANDPVACTGKSSPGVQNTWPKWAPGPNQGNDGKTYYWLTFSSTRSPTAPGKAQLYVTAIVVDASGGVTTYPSIYLWNQDPKLNNLIPAWDNFKIPPGTMHVF
ncbi:MAG: hypothetical protein M3O36_17725 [Myxococcota bacterium]|nr:hypothetical protein [Myxococcota bacterium]